MLSPEEARKKVKQRIRSKQNAADRAEEAALDYIEEAIARYLSTTDFIDYVTRIVDETLVEARSAGQSELFVGFTWYASRESSEDYVDKNASICYIPYDSDRGGWLCVFRTENCGIDAPIDDLAERFLEIIATEYINKGYRNLAAGDYLANTATAGCYAFRL